MLMEQGILTGVLAISLAFMNPSSNTYIQTTTQQVAEMRDYHVKEGETLTSIANDIYGSTDFWTTIWNDNAEIESPNLIEKNSILKIRNTKPTEPEELDKELSEKLAPKFVAKPVTQTAQITPSPTANPVAQAPAVQSNTGNPLNDTQILYLGQCEAGMDPAKNTGNGYYGAFQFSYSTWKSMGTAYERADLAPLDVQIDAVQRLLKRSSIFTQFPGCARKMQALGML
jgi:hypothetical protein